MQRSHRRPQKNETERDPSLTSDNQARPDQLGTDTAQVGPDSGGQSGSAQDLSSVAEAGDESVEELAEEEQSFEAGILDGVEYAGDHPERPVRVHGRPSDLLMDPRVQDNETSEGNGPDEDAEDVA